LGVLVIIKYFQQNYKKKFERGKFERKTDGNFILKNSGRNGVRKVQVKNGPGKNQGKMRKTKNKKTP
jgi:hypothetical protein